MSGMRKRISHIMILLLVFLIINVSNDITIWAEPEGTIVSESNVTNYEEALISETEAQQSRHFGLMDSLVIDNKPIASDPVATVHPGMEGIQIPASYDSRLYGRVTSVKNQDESGTCWLHGSLAAMESSLISSGRADQGINLSESYAMYQMFCQTNENSGTISGDYDYIKDANGLVRDFYLLGNVGGWHSDVGFQAISRKGPIRENEDVYKTDSVPVGAYVPEHGNEVLSEYYLKDFYMVPVKQNPMYVKSLIMKYGGVAANYYADQPYGRYYYIDSNTDITFYNPHEEKKGSHIVEIIGWDDNYPAENFRMRPPHNGAWLVKNSWGTAYPVINSGYHWISYDYGFENSEAVAFEFGDIIPQQKLYQNDGTNQKDLRSLAGTGQTQCFVEVFQAVGSSTGTEVIDSVGVGIDPHGMDFKVSILTGVKYKKNFIGKQLEWSDQKGITVCSKPCNGYYTIALSEPVVVESGDLFGVCIEMQPGAEIYASFSYGYQTTAKSQNGIVNIIYGRNESIVEGTSFWGKGMQTFNMDLEDTYCLKAYSTPGSYVPVERVSISKSDIVLRKGGRSSAALSAAVSPQNAVPDIIWESSDTSVATVDKNGVVKAVSPGYCSIYAYSFNRKKYGYCSVTVLKNGQENIDLSLSRVKFKKVKNPKKRTISVSWSTNLKYDGYELQLATDYNYSRRQTVKMVSPYTKSCKIKGYKAKRAYLRIRGYIKESDGDIRYTQWNEKDIKMKKL